ncbi:NHLP-related RiPP peptide [Xanthomonas sp. 4461]|uniref:NHLP-related RiPP peptide n=1 Tax=Xanthomonas sp. 10-10 TaxID=3115848 RepID=A0AAU7P9J9_9XANT|nr:NHLP-related RiPP peptide [Xanthomonas sp. 4461]MCS3811331.1 putative modified peptide [Xanthomonas sp. 4461]
MSTLENSKSLLQRLATDDEFRASMEKDPIAAFAEYGFKIEKSEAPIHVDIPSKEDINAGLDEMAKRIEDTCGFDVFRR